MAGVKLLLKTAELCSILAAVFMLWTEEALSCGYYTAKVFITMFILAAIILAKETTKLQIQHDNDNVEN